MSPRTMLRTGASACLVLALATVPLAAHADGHDGYPSGTITDDGDHQITLAADESGRDHEVTVFDISNVVPGDNGDFTVDVTNGGPTPGTLRVYLPPVVLEGDAGRTFYDEITLAGPDLDPTPVSALSTRQTPLIDKRVEPGQTIPVTLTYNFPAEATGGNETLDGEHIVRVYLRAEIEGEDLSGPLDDPLDNPANSPQDITGVTLGLLAVGAGLLGASAVTFIASRRKGGTEGEQR